MPPKYGRKRKNINRKKKNYIPRNKTRRNELYFTRTSYNGIPSQGPTHDIADNYFFSIANLDQSSEITRLFQKIRLLSVDCRWIPKYTVTTAGSGIISNNIMVAFNGQNDQTGVPSKNDMLQQSRMKMYNVTKAFSIRIYPVIKQQLGSSGVTTYYSQKPSSQVGIDSTSLDLRMYGLDWYMEASGLATGVNIGVWELKYNMLAQVVR